MKTLKMNFLETTFERVKISRNKLRIGHKAIFKGSSSCRNWAAFSSRGPGGIFQTHFFVATFLANH